VRINGICYGRVTRYPETICRLIPKRRSLRLMALRGAVADPGFLKDLKHSARMFPQTPGFTIVAIAARFGQRFFRW
jgi:hypothetical protein